MSDHKVQSKSGCKSIFYKFLFVLSVIATFLGLLLLFISISGGMPPVTGFITALMLILPLCITLIIRLRRSYKGLHHFDKKSRCMLGIVIILVVTLLASIIFILVSGQEFSIKVESGAILNGYDLSGNDYSGKELSNASMQNTTLENVNFSNANLTGVDFSRADLKRAIFSDAILAKNTFDSANLSGTIGLSDEQLAQAIDISIEDLYAITAQKQIVFEDRDQVLRTLSIVCNQGIVESAHRYDPESTFHTLVILDSVGNPNNFTNTAFNNKWEPTAIRFADLVACVSDEEKEIIETCQYEEGEEISRIARIREVRVIVAQTGEILYQDKLYYQLPRECPIYISENEPDLRGWGPGDKQILEKLESFVIIAKH